jgi:hypothetical protein
MDSDQKLAASVLLSLGGIIWLILCLIWMPPICYAIVFSAVRLHVPMNALPFTLMRYESVLPLSFIAFGVYLALERKLKTSRTEGARGPS